LSEWIGDEGNPRQADAVRHIGTNALPFLIGWIRYETPAWQVKSMELLYRANTRLWAKLGGRNVRPAILGLRGFEILGPTASPAIPDLVRIMKGTNFSLAAYAMDAICMTGSKGFPVLLDVLTNRQAYARRLHFGLVTVMGRLGTNVSVMAPEVIEALKSKDPETVATAATMLGEMRAEAKLAVPALTNCLQSLDAQIRLHAVYALGKFGPGARSAVPCLIECLRDPNQSVHEAATNALKRVAPEVLENGEMSGKRN
jgi:hypothetical protein